MHSPRHYLAARWALLSCLAIATHIAHANTSTAQAEALEEEQVAVPGTKALPQVVVVGTTEEQRLQPSSATVINQKELRASRGKDVNEALRRVRGINVRDEEGFGMRTNIGISGLNPTRSMKVLLLEDGIPAAYAPYGDNSSYYHAPVDRYDRIEVLKGSGMLRFGPQLVGGAINYITPPPRREFGGFGALTLGDRNYQNMHAQVGGEGHLLDVIRRAGDGARDNVHLQQTDVNYKYVLDVNDAHALIFRANYMNEDSQVTYSGITDNELKNFGHDYNPFENDRFLMNRYGASVTHMWQASDNVTFTTNLYGSIFERDWWRQSSTTRDSQCGAAFRNDRNMGRAVDPNLCNSIQGRLREYHTWGLDPHINITHALGEFEAGIRWHEETQNRVQRNLSSPDYHNNNYTKTEDNQRRTDAVATYLQNRFDFGKLSITPVLRLEEIDYDRRNKMPGKETRGDTETSDWIPGIGFTYALTDATTLYGGVHRGFAPPRAEDIISGSTGGTVDVSAERSTNRELGIRYNPSEQVSVDAVWFSNAFDKWLLARLLAVAAPLAEGKARYEGWELASHIDMTDLFDLPRTPYARLAYTWLNVAEQEGEFVAVETGAAVGNSGDDQRMPYAPEDLVTFRLGYKQGSWDGSVEAVYIGSQYADFENSENPVLNGDGSQGNWTSKSPTTWHSTTALERKSNRIYGAEEPRQQQLHC
ncbi:MAG: TonB-dependent receptor [Cellvibrionales bacterium]|nr:TonB-dependent receptor [Cellvibrionales bacterium]